MRIRVQKGWSQSELAAACQRLGWDVSRGVIARIEGKVRWVADSELLSLARALSVLVPDLFPANKRHLFTRANQKN